jgi:hypothetical protein
MGPSIIFGILRACYFAELSVPLRAEMTLFLNSSLVQRMTWFDDKDDAFVAAILPKLDVEYFAPVSLGGAAW